MNIEELRAVRDMGWIVLYHIQSLRVLHSIFVATPGDGLCRRYRAGVIWKCFLREVSASVVPYP